jgi:hypothetical protein
MYGYNQKQFKGGKMNPDLLRIEIERIVNLVVGFGWTKSEEKVSENEVLLVLKKIIPVTKEE